jgi:hypothetical protein
VHKDIRTAVIGTVCGSERNEGELRNAGRPSFNMKPLFWFNYVYVVGSFRCWMGETCDSEMRMRYHMKEKDKPA